MQRANWEDEIIKGVKRALFLKQDQLTTQVCLEECLEVKKEHVQYFLQGRPEDFGAPVQHENWALNLQKIKMKGQSFKDEKLKF